MILCSRVSWIFVLLDPSGSHWRASSIDDTLLVFLKRLETYLAAMRWIISIFCISSFWLGFHTDAQYFHTYVGSGHFFGFKILNFNIFWSFRKKWTIFGVWRFCVYFLGSSQNWTIFRGHFYALCILGSFLKVKVQNGGIFWLLKFHFFWGDVLQIPDIFFLRGGGGGRICHHKAIGFHSNCPDPNGNHKEQV